MVAKKKNNFFGDLHLPAIPTQSQYLFQSARIKFTIYSQTIKNIYSLSEFFYFIFSLSSCKSINLFSWFRQFFPELLSQCPVRPPLVCHRLHSIVWAFSKGLGGGEKKTGGKFSVSHSLYFSALLTSMLSFEKVSSSPFLMVSNAFSITFDESVSAGAGASRTIRPAKANYRSMRLEKQWKFLISLLFQSVLD